MIKMNDTFDRKIYDKYFDDIIRKRGERYFGENKVHNLTKSDNTYTLEVKGSNKYNVSITFQDSDEILIKEMSCTCPYYEEHKNCKHIYASLLEIKYGGEKDNLINETKNILKSVKSRIEVTKEYTHKSNSRKNKDIIEYTRSIISNYYVRINAIESYLLKDNYIISAYEDALKLEEDSERVLGKQIKEIRSNEEMTRKTHKSKGILSSLFGLFIGSLKTIEKEESEEDALLEAEKEKYRRYVKEQMYSNGYSDEDAYKVIDEDAELRDYTHDD